METDWLVMAVAARIHSPAGDQLTFQIEFLTILMKLPELRPRRLTNVKKSCLHLDIWQQSTGQAASDATHLSKLNYAYGFSSRSLTSEYHNREPDTVNHDPSSSFSVWFAAFWKIFNITLALAPSAPLSRFRKRDVIQAVRADGLNKTVPAGSPRGFKALASASA